VQPVPLSSGCNFFLIDFYFASSFFFYHREVSSVCDEFFRGSFWIGGAIGLVGVFLRRRLRETSTFKELEHPDVDKEAYLHAVKNQKSRIALGVAFGAINASTYYLIATYIPTHFSNVIGLNIYWNTFVSFGILLLSTALLPVFGILAEKFNNKKMLIYSAFSIIILLTPIYFSILKNNLFMMLILAILYIIPLSCLSSLLAYRIAHLFSARVRYTGTSLAFNLADGLAGGFTPAIALLLFQITSNPASFCWYILVCSLISLISYFKIKE
jgi:MHS family proline/betaine transporter-like MFS transporter